jgi:hypothetical protein
MTTREVLIAAQALIADPKHWTRGANARDATGRWTNTYGNRAVSWCALGAVCRVSTMDEVRADALGILRGLAEADGSGLTEFNDSRRHAAVIELFDRAIKAAA